MAKANDDSAPSYEELYHNHPVNQHPPSGSSSAYAPLALHDDIVPPPAPDVEAQTPLQDLNGASHAHCDVCEDRQDRRETRQHQKRICGIVAVTVMVAFICFMILGIVFFDGWFDLQKKRH